jgi:membrane-bound metal-dependent hydrolase YbcI (DUF457 family)
MWVNDRQARSVDPVSHLAVGGLVGALTARRVAPPATGSRGVLAGFLLGSLVPDIDCVVMPTGWDRYLVAHEFATHSVVGTIAPAVITALVIMAAARRGHAGFRLLLLAAWLGALGHLLLDVVSGGTSRILWPLVDARLSVPLVGMADPILGVPLGLSLVGSIVRRRAAPRWATATLVVLAGLLALKGVSYAAARHVVATRVEAGTPRLLEPEWACFRHWLFFDRQANTLRAWRITAWPPLATLRFSRTIADETPEVTASRGLNTVRHFDAVFDLGFHETTRGEGRTTVLWSDIRLCDATACALWFGGEFDAAGRPLEQVVLVGEWRQGRAP